MKKNFTLLFSTFVILILSSVSVNAQKKVPNIIISEACLGYIGEYGRPEFYMELTNLEDTAVCLADGFMVIAKRGENRAGRTLKINKSDCLTFTAKDVIQPGGTYVIATDSRGYNSLTGELTVFLQPAMRAAADTVINTVAGSAVEVSKNYLRCSNGDEQMWLLNDIDGDGVVESYADSMGIYPEIIDVAGDVTGSNGSWYTTVAGVEEGQANTALVRRPTVSHGNAGKFLEECGTDFTDADWWPIPLRAELGEVFTTVGAWDETNYSFSANGTGVTIDEGAKTITMPWGINRNEIFTYFNFGPNMAWKLEWGDADSTSFAVQTGDVFTVYKIGENLVIEDYAITVSPQTGDECNMVPIYNIDPLSTRLWQMPIIPIIKGTVSEVDTIKIDPSLHRDTLKSLFVYPTGAEVSFIYANSGERTNLYDGDKMIVTSKNGNDLSTYYISAGPYFPSSNTQLENLLSDVSTPGTLTTLWDFSPANRSYVIEMEDDATQFPSVSAVLQDPNATFVYKAPKKFFGAKEDRTGSITVTAEDDTTIAVITIEFKVPVPPSKVQPDGKEPIISQVLLSYRRRAFEICNVSNKALDLSKYFIYMSSGNNVSLNLWNESNLFGLGVLKNKMRFGYAYDTSKVAYEFVINPSCPSSLEPGDVFAMGQANPNDKQHLSELDYMGGTPGSNLEYYGFIDGNSLGYTLDNHEVGSSYWLMKIVNDSVIAGLKPLNQLSDLELVDVYGAVGDYNNNLVINNSVHYGRDIDAKIIRKPEITVGNTVSHGSFGNSPEESEWIVTFPYAKEDHGIGSHYFIPTTDFSSTIVSSVYRVSNGFSSSETIDGVADNTTQGLFLSNIIKKDEGQTLQVYRTDQLLGATEILAEGDLFRVTSADGKNTTTYIIQTLGGLSSDAELVSDKYNISVDGSTGSINGVGESTTVSEFMGNITVPAGAFIVMHDANGNMINQYNVNTVGLDSIGAVVGAVVPGMLIPNSVIDVIAPNGNTITYNIPSGELGDPYITSMVYAIDQDAKKFEYIPLRTNVSALMANITPSPGATIAIFDVSGSELTSYLNAPVNVDTKIVVTRGDKSTTYNMHGSTITGIETVGVDQPEAYLAYPNPTSGILNITNLKAGSNIVIYNLAGQVVSTRKAQSTMETINLSENKSGIYIVLIRSSKGVSTLKIVKQ